MAAHKKRDAYGSRADEIFAERRGIENQFDFTHHPYHQ